MLDGPFNPKPKNAVTPEFVDAITAAAEKAKPFGLVPVIGQSAAAEQCPKCTPACESESCRPHRLPSDAIRELKQQLAAATAERDHLQAEIEDMINLVPEAHRIIAREGAGPENPAMSLCLSINRLGGRSEKLDAARELLERWNVSDTYRDGQALADLCGLLLS